MATVADLIRDSLELLGVLAAGEPLKAADQETGLRRLNKLLGSWANERLLVYGTRRSVFALTPSLSPHTIGASGTFIAQRPNQIDRAGIIAAGQATEVEIDVLTDAQYAAIGDKAQTGTTPSSLWAEKTHPNMRLWLWPVPTTGASLVLYTTSRITSLASASETVDLPDGYEEALEHALALRLAPSFGVDPSSLLLSNAESALASIQRANAPDVVSQLDPAVASRGGFNILTGE